MVSAIEGFRHSKVSRQGGTSWFNYKIPYWLAGRISQFIIYVLSKLQHSRWHEMTKPWLCAFSD